jgi:ComF family protein
MLSLATVSDALIATLFAPPCASCGAVLETPTSSPVCETCWRNVRRITPPICAVCGGAVAVDAHVLCPLAGSPLRAARALGPYEGVLRDLVQAIKFEHRRSLATPLGAMLHEASREILEGADALVPVPLHPWRHWRRGFNQADDLARVLAGPRLPILRALRRGRATSPQSALHAGARRANVADAFRLNSWTARGASRQRARIAGRTLALVDDVMTTGATLESAARVLLDAGAREVRAVTLARVEAHESLEPQITQTPRIAPR